MAAFSSIFLQEAITSLEGNRAFVRRVEITDAIKERNIPRWAFYASFWGFILLVPGPILTLTRPDLVLISVLFHVPVYPDAVHMLECLRDCGVCTDDGSAFSQLCGFFVRIRHLPRVWILLRLKQCQW